MYYFASDIHLGAGDAATARAVERRFVAWLDDAARDAEAIFLVGDIFDFWFEYRRVVPKGFVRTLGKLAELTDRGVRVVFFTGNHDMWVGDYLARECGLEIHTSPEVMTLSFATQIHALCFLGKNYRYIKVLCSNTGDTDTGCFNCKDFSDWTVGEAAFEFFADFIDEGNIHLMI